MKINEEQTRDQSTLSKPDRKVDTFAGLIAHSIRSPSIYLFGT